MMPDLMFLTALVTVWYGRGAVREWRSLRPAREVRS